MTQFFGSRSALRCSASLPRTTSPRARVLRSRCCVLIPSSSSACGYPWHCLVRPLLPRPPRPRPHDRFLADPHNPLIAQPMPVIDLEYSTASDTGSSSPVPSPSLPSPPPPSADSKITAHPPPPPPAESSLASSPTPSSPPARSADSSISAYTHAPSSSTMTTASISSSHEVDAATSVDDLTYMVAAMNPMSDDADADRALNGAVDSDDHPADDPGLSTEPFCDDGEVDDTVRARIEYAKIISQYTKRQLDFSLQRSRQRSGDSLAVDDSRGRSRS
ncbi:hypothetical protein BZA70DRAFT_264854 [Myxozyma melibiosi]|uniref:Uncharacterized protein n=1 Tax=Myxozyma melibiosi TaxID=54550 RepID=A0ABR1FCA9_9ASCO